MQKKICWRITRRCNLSCIFCLASENQYLDRELNTRQVLLILDFLKNCGINKVTFSGGEPLLREDFRTILSACYRKGIDTTITTNGILLNEAWHETLSHGNIVTKVSIHGTKSIHDSQVRANIYDLVLDNLKSLSRSGSKVAVNCVLSRLNSESIKVFLEEISDVALDHILFQYLIYRGRAKNLHSIDLLKDEKEKLEDDLFYWIEKIGYKFNIKFNDYAKENIPYLILESDGTLVIANDYTSKDIKVGPCSEKNLIKAINSVYNLDNFSVFQSQYNHMNGDLFHQ